MIKWIYCVVVLLFAAGATWLCIRAEVNSRGVRCANRRD